MADYNLSTLPQKQADQNGDIYAQELEVAAGGSISDDAALAAEIEQTVPAGVKMKVRIEIRKSFEAV